MSGKADGPSTYAAIGQAQVGNRDWLRHLKWEHLVAGTAGGVAATMVLHPFDLLKIRLQVNDGLSGRPKYTGLSDAFRSIVNHGGVRGLYQGVSPNVWGAGCSWGLYFFAYNFLKANLQSSLNVDSLSAKHHLAAGFLAGTGTLTLTNPIWVVKTRMCLQYSEPAARAEGGVYYKGLFDGLMKLFKSEGIRGYYKGYVPGLFGVSHGAVQFMAYEEAKKLHSRYTGKPVSEKLGPLEYILMAASSKSFAVVTTYPYQILRSRLQDQHLTGRYAGAIDIGRAVLANEGLLGFYKGLVPNLLRVTPAACITFLVYENIVHTLFVSKNT